MTQHCVLGILVLVVCSLLEVSTFPSSNESTTSVEDVTEASDEKDERSLTYDKTNIEKEEAAKEIIKKIIAVNEALKKPNRRHPVLWSAPPPASSGYTLDKDILEKLQQAIASGKLHPYHNNMKQQETNAIINEDFNDVRYSRRISPLVSNNQIATSAMPTAYMTSIPVLVMPSMMPSNAYGNSENYVPQYQTREGPSPFQPFQLFQNFGQFPWPLAPLFPILIRDPLLSIFNGGGFQNFVEVGQSADVCNRKQKSEEIFSDLTENEILEKTAKLLQTTSSKKKSRAKRAVKKRTVSVEKQLKNTNKAKKLFSTKPFTAKPTKPEPVKITKTTDENEGDLRFPFFFGHQEKLPNGPGITINKLMVRKGGVAIAGPGGVATAGRGGTAIVGPGGLAYTQPGGIAVAGPAARVIALSSDADLTSIVHRLQQQNSTGEHSGSVTESGAATNTENGQTYTDTTE